MVERDIAAVCIRLSGGTTELRPVPARDTQFLLLDHALGSYVNRSTFRHAFRIHPAAFGLGGYSDQEHWRRCLIQFFHHALQKTRLGIRNPSTSYGPPLLNSNSSRPRESLLH